MALSSCALSSGYTLDCRDSMGGIKSVYLSVFENVSGVTESSGTATAISKANGGRFYKFNLTRATGEWKEEYVDNSANGTSFHTQTLTMVFNKMTAATSQQIKTIAQNRLVAVVEDRNGKYWYLGQDVGLEREGGMGGSGKDGGDRNGYEINLTTQNRGPALEVQSSVITGLETA